MQQETKRQNTTNKMSEVVSFNKQGQERSVTDRGVGGDVSGMGC